MLVVVACTCAPTSKVNARQDSLIKNEHFENPIRVAQDFTQTPAPANSPFVAPPKFKTVATPLRSFGVPFQINADNESFIEVQLYVSRDMGRTWRFHSRQTTDQVEFPFQADGDGEYWFALKTLDRDRKLVPQGDPQIDLKIVVDSVKPELEFKIETDAAGRVVCRWKATDDNIVPQSLRILYQPVGSNGLPGQWTEVPVKLSGMARAGIYADQLAWWPETTERLLNVAVELKDIAGNTVQLDRQVRVTQAGWRNQSTSIARPAPQNQVQTQNDPWSASQSLSQNQGNSNSVTAKKVSSSSQPTQPSAHPDGFVCKDGICTPVTADPDHSFESLPGNLSAMMVDGKLGVDYSAPPTPDGYDPSENMASRHGFTQSGGIAISNPHVQQPGSGSSNSRVWESESTRWNTESQTSIGSTMRPDPRLAPDPFPHRPDPRPVTNVPSNPGRTFHRGDQVVGESSTQGQTNQYRGMHVQNGRTIVPPTLAPSVEGVGRDSFSTNPNVPNGANGPRNNMDGNWQGGQQVVGADRRFRANNSFEVEQPERFSNDRQNTGPANSARQHESFSQQESFLNAGFAQPQSQPTPAKPRANSQRNLRPISPTLPTRAPLQIIGSKRFRLNYGIDSIDPSGVAKVDLWQTRDGGRTWNVWGSDPDNQSPFPVQVQEEGRYGFRVVVHSKDGLTGQGPSSGDDPDMWILVDTQSPLVRISSVPYGRNNEAGRLVINYSVADKHLTLRPVALAYASNPQGPWNEIASGLRNESRYVWKPTPDIPDRIFLRIDALDKAGNVGVHVLSQAIDVSGLVPRGTIHGVTPVGERSPRRQ